MGRQSGRPSPAEPTTARVENDFDWASGSAGIRFQTVAHESVRPACQRWKQDGGQWVFEYDRNDDSLPPATTQVVQYGNDLSGWTDITIPATSSGTVTVTPGTPTDHVRVVIPNLGGKVFARLKVTQ